MNSAVMLFGFGAATALPALAFLGLAIFRTREPIAVRRADRACGLALVAVATAAVTYGLYEGTTGSDLPDESLADAILLVYCAAAASLIVCLAIRSALLRRRK